MSLTDKRACAPETELSLILEGRRAALESSKSTWCGGCTLNTSITSAKDWRCLKSRSQQLNNVGRERWCWPFVLQLCSWNLHWATGHSHCEEWQEGSQRYQFQEKHGANFSSDCTVTWTHWKGTNSRRTPALGERRIFPWGCHSCASWGTLSWRTAEQPETFTLSLCRYCVFQFWPRCCFHCVLRPEDPLHHFSFQPVKRQILSSSAVAFIYMHELCEVTQSDPQLWVLSHWVWRLFESPFRSIFLCVS